MNARNVRKFRLRRAAILEHLKENISRMSRKKKFYGHCYKHLYTEDHELIRWTLDPANRFGGSCFYFKEYSDLKRWLVYQIKRSPVIDEIAAWLAEGSPSCVFYIDAMNIGKAYLKRGHDWKSGALCCDQAIIVLERCCPDDMDNLDFFIKTAYPLPE